MESIHDSIHVRCPECSKLYVVDRQEIRTEKPQFECLRCSTRFWFHFPPPSDAREVRSFRIGHPDAEGQGDVPVKTSPIQQISPMGTAKSASEEIQSSHPEIEWKSIEEKTAAFLCYKCGKPNQKGAVECRYCGLVFEKSRRAANGGPKENVPASSALRKNWEAIKENYGNESLHEAFLKLALAEKNLAYASQQYRILLEVNPTDDIASRMRDKIIHMASTTYTPPIRKHTPSKIPSAPAIFMGLGVLLVVLGLLIEAIRPAVPTGAAFLTVGLGFFLIRRR